MNWLQLLVAEMGFDEIVWKSLMNWLQMVVAEIGLDEIVWIFYGLTILFLGE